MPYHAYAARVLGVIGENSYLIRQCTYFLTSSKHGTEDFCALSPGLKVAVHQHNAIRGGQNIFSGLSQLIRSPLHTKIPAIFKQILVGIIEAMELF
ncbi:hypothetical protein D3C76_1562660 [compost metagenome]